MSIRKKEQKKTSKGALLQPREFIEFIHFNYFHMRSKSCIQNYTCLYGKNFPFYKTEYIKTVFHTARSDYSTLNVTFILTPILFLRQ